MRGRERWGSRSNRAGAVGGGVATVAGRNCEGGRSEARRGVDTALPVESLKYGSQWEVRDEDEDNGTNNEVDHDLSCSTPSPSCGC